MTWSEWTAEGEFAKLRADLAEAVALLREVERFHIEHSRKEPRCALHTEPTAACTCGQWLLVARIEYFTTKQPTPKEQP